ncbi:unnamed protein product [Prorocentrum cordatum]|uniref:Uncharacterized protein n=1 Tax=Prorocentrum cordatum TaxID=2364126 RepID=A0ABN9R677_9DINO|nr:unnamed protein product [Polarella glacialis]
MARRRRRGDRDGSGDAPWRTESERSTGAPSSRGGAAAPGAGRRARGARGEPGARRQAGPPPREQGSEEEEGGNALRGAPGCGGHEASERHPVGLQRSERSASSFLLLLFLVFSPLSRRPGPPGGTSGAAPGRARERGPARIQEIRAGRQKFLFMLFFLLRIRPVGSPTSGSFRLPAPSAAQSSRGRRARCFLRLAGPE